MILIIFLVLGGLRPSPAAQAQPLHRPAEVYSPPINRWRTGCIECPRSFYTLTDHSLRLDSAGRAHIAYGGDALYYAWHDGAAWQSEIVDGTAAAGHYASLALDAWGYPHIAYFVDRVALYEVRYAYKDASGWHISTVDGPGQISGFTALALDAVGYPHIVYYKDIALNYAYQDASGWHMQVIDSKGWVGQYNSIAIDAQGYAHVSYYDASDDSDLRYAYQDAGGWHIQVVDSSGAAGQGSSLALDANDCPHITYYEGIARVVMYAYQQTCPAEGGWQIQTIGPAGVSMGSTSLALDAQGFAHASYYNDNDSSLSYAYQDAGGWHTQVIATGSGSNYVSLAWDGSTGAHIISNGSSLVFIYPGASGWEEEIVDRSDRVETGSELAIDGQGNLHIAYLEANSPGLRYASRVGGEWQVQTLDGISDPFGMGLDNQGYAHFCHADGGLAYTYQDVSGWHTTVVDPDGSSYSCYIAVDSQDYPHIIYYSSPFHGEGWRYTYQDTAGWHTSYLGYYDFTACALALDEQDYAHILSIGGILTYVYQDGSGWGSTVLESGLFNYGALALDANGYAHASYYDVIGGDLKYAHQDASGWYTDTVDTEGDPGKYTAIAVDAQGYPHISYHDSEFPYTGNLKYAFQDAAGWHVQTVDTTYSTGYNTSIVLDGSGKPYISYYNDVTSDLMLAYPLLDRAFLPMALKGYQQPHRLELRLDEPAGATAFADASGSNHPAWCTGASCPAAGQPGVRGTAVQFDGLDDFITLGNPAGLNFTGRVTLEAWVWLQSTTGVQDILAHGYTLTPERELFLRLSNGMYQAGSWDGTGHYAAFAIPAEDVGAWVYLAGVYDGTYWRLYRNGVEVSASEQPQGALLVEANWAVGAAGSGTERFFSGRLDEVNLYARALPAEEIWQHYQNSLR